jgi:small subunit ribosomal protein S9
MADSTPTAGSASKADKNAGFVWGTGRRKTAVARVRIYDGTGKITVNKRAMEEYFPTPAERARARSALVAVHEAGSVDVHVTVQGGGIAAQSGAISLGLARALVKRNPDHEGPLRDGRFMTRDSRVKERKKYGRAAARRSFQFSKR